MDRFTETTGRPMVPPPFAYGPRRRINVKATRTFQGTTAPEIELMRANGLAITGLDDALHFLPNGSDVGQEANLADWVKQGTARGYHMNAYYNPYIADLPHGALAADRATGLADHYFLTDASGMPSIVDLISGSFLHVLSVDVTSPDATAWFTRMFDRATALGYTGWMYDFGEYVQPTVLAANGMTGEELHNLYPIVYQKAAHDYLEAKNPGRWFLFARSGYTGASQFAPLTWGGDPDASFGEANGLPAMVRGGLNLSISGAPNWGSDIGGFKCIGAGAVAADGELVARWIQFGAMSPNMQDQDACSGGNSSLKASIWTSPDAFAAWKTYAKLHTRLFPYFYTLAKEAHATGAPIMRAMFLDHPTHDFAQVGDQFYLGPSLLAAPVVARGARSRDVVLPDGLFLDWQAPALVPGGGTATVAAPLDKLPLLLPDGALLPLLDPSIETLADFPHPGVVGPSDVKDVYDVVGFLSAATGHTQLGLYDGTALDVTWKGGFTPPPGYAPAASEADLAGCLGCYLVTPVADKLRRVRVTSPAASVTAGGLTLSAESSRLIRWDLYLVDP
jgi:alpha-glucosidase (family GH31 glycosyl hydrolase)